MDNIEAVGILKLRQICKVHGEDTLAEAIEVILDDYKSVKTKLEKIETKLKIDYKETLEAIDTIDDEDDSMPVRQVGEILCGYINNCIKEIGV